MFSVVDIRYNLSVLHRMFLKFKKFLFIFDQYFPFVSDFHVSIAKLKGCLLLSCMKKFLHVD